MIIEGAGEPVGLIGGIGLTEVRVYAQRPAPDGLFSGCPHVHAVVDEGYFVLAGRGAVEFHDLTNGYRKLELEPGQYVHFPPCVMHRLISDGELVILGMMGSAGLAERGEARIYFGADVDADPSRFDELVSLPKRSGLEGALKRRDESVKAYQKFRKLWTDDRDAYFVELKRFIDLHCAAMAKLGPNFLEQIRNGPVAHAVATKQRIEALPSHRVEPDFDVRFNRRGADSAFGMCGVLRPILSLEKIKLSVEIR